MPGTRPGMTNLMPKSEFLDRILNQTLRRRRPVTQADFPRYRLGQDCKANSHIADRQYCMTKMHILCLPQNHFTPIG